MNHIRSRSLRNSSSAASSQAHNPPGVPTVARLVPLPALEVSPASCKQARSRTESCSHAIQQLACGARCRSRIVLLVSSGVRRAVHSAKVRACVWRPCASLCLKSVQTHWRCCMRRILRARVTGRVWKAGRECNAGQRVGTHPARGRPRALAVHRGAALRRSALLLRGGRVAGCTEEIRTGSGHRAPSCSGPVDEL